MKNLNTLFRGIGCALLLLWSHSASGQGDRFYFKGDIGGQWTSDVSLKEFFGTPVSGYKVAFDPGVRAGLALGLRITDWLATEFETGVYDNKIDSITGASSLDATFDNVPLLFNVRLQVPRMDRVTPYIGGGVGASISILDIDHMDLNNIHVHGNDADVVFAYQGFAGVRFRLMDRVGLSVEYHYLGTDSARWSGIHFGGNETHSISAALDVRF
jgi:opacity protein-like surface antigen